SARDVGRVGRSRMGHDEYTAGGKPVAARHWHEWHVAAQGPARDEHHRTGYKHAKYRRREESGRADVAALSADRRSLSVACAVASRAEFPVDDECGSAARRARALRLDQRRTESTAPRGHSVGIAATARGGVGRLGRARRAYRGDARFARVRGRRRRDAVRRAAATFFCAVRGDQSVHEAVDREPAVADPHGLAAQQGATGTAMSASTNAFAARNEPPDLEPLVAALLARAPRMNFMQLCRLLEVRVPAHPGFGTRDTAEHEPVRFRPRARTGFPAGEIAAVEFDGDADSFGPPAPPTVRTTFIGVYGVK